MEDENKKGAETACKAFTEPQAVDQEVNKEAETPVDPPAELETKEHTETLGAYNKLLAEEQESKKEAETSAEASSKLQTVEQETKDEAETPVDRPVELETKKQAEMLGASIKLLAEEQEGEKEAETPAEAASKLQTVEQKAQDEAENPAKSIQSQPPETTAANSLRKMVKKSAAKSLVNIRKGKDILKVQKKIVKNKGVSQVISEGSRNEETKSSKEEFVEQENKRETETPVEIFTKFQASEQETGNEAEMQAETSVHAKAKASQSRTPDSIKVRAMLMKKASPKTSDGKAAPNRVPRKIVKKNKGVPPVLNERSGNSEATAGEPASPHDNARMVTVTDGKNTARNKIRDTSHSEDKNGKEPASGGNDSGKMQSKQGKIGKFEGREEKHKNGQNHSLNEKVENPKKKEKVGNVGVDRGKKVAEKKEKTGGLIFLCSSKTKPDCIKYRVMGVPERQKDMVFGVKPGLKLFLYDYDLKLMYGIYKASSAGGKKLEPRAFGGAFPYQVRFKVQVDCFPLPDSIFKKAMAENFITKHKFKTELTVKQVRRLTELFRPVEIRPVQPQLNSLPTISSRKERRRDRVARLSVRKSRHHPEGETFQNDTCAGRDERRFPPHVHERDQLVSHREVREDPPREMFLTENEYRAYGLRGERRKSDLSSRAASSLDPCWEDYERRRQSDVVNQDAMAAHRDHLRVGPSFSDYQRYKTYSFNSRRNDPIADRYPDYLRRRNVSSPEAYWTEPDRDIRRREIDPIDRIYLHSRHAEYDLRGYRVMEPDSSILPVSSRYSFAGPR